MSTLIYLLLRSLLRVVLSVYFTRIEIDGEESLPDGPLVLAANHPNTFIDVALVATRVRRRIYFVAKAPLFRNPLLGWFLRAMGAVPVERRMERQGADLDPEAQARNAAALAACEVEVARGGALLIFPEGTTARVPKLLPLKTGAARIALGAEARRDRGDVVVVPVAVLYDRPQTFRSRARVRFLPPIPVAPYQELEARDAVGAARALTAAIRDALEPSVVHVDDDALLPLVREIEALYGSQLAVAQTGDELAAAAAISRAVNHFARTEPERMALFREKLEAYRAALEKAGVEDLAVRPGPSRPTPGQVTAFLIGAPLALVGIVFHAVPYHLTRFVTGAVRPDVTFISTIELISGTFIYLAAYVAAGFGLTRMLGLWPGLAATLALPLCGLVALEEMQALEARSRRRRRREMRARILPATLRELERLRQGVVIDLDRARAEYLSDRLEEGGASG